jgi:hypothetical protein
MGKSAMAVPSVYESLDSGGPVLLHSGDGLVFAHGRYISLAEVYARDEQVDKVCGQCISRRLAFPSRWLDAVLHTCPECLLVYVQLISEDVAPDLPAVVAPVYRVRDPRPQDSPVVEVQFISDVMRAGPALRISYRLPSSGRTCSSAGPLTWPRTVVISRRG